MRQMRRFKQILSEEDCLDVLERGTHGVMAIMADDDYPYAVPINYYFDPKLRKIYFHGGRLGHKIDAMRRHDKVSFCVTDQGFRREGEWALNFRSVVIFGRVEFIEARERVIEISRRICYKFTDDEAYIEDEIRRAAAGTLCFALTPEYISGKRVNES